MPNSKFKSENYQNFGGINSKASPYLTGPHEFLDLKNFDFQIPGSLSSRWGSTQHIQSAANFTGSINALYEFNRLSGFSQIIIGVSGGLWAGSTTGQYTGLSLSFEGTTTMAGAKIWQFFTNGSSYFFPQSTSLADTVLQQIPYLSTSATFTVAAEPHTMNNFSMVTFVNYLFLADGTKFLKFDGTNTSLVGLPGGLAQGISASVQAGDAAGLIGPGYFYTFYASYTNSRGFQGPIWPVGYLDYPSSLNGGTIFAAFGNTNIAVTFPILQPQAYGISSINLYVYQGVSTTGYSVPVSGMSLYAYPYRFQKNVPVSGGSFSFIQWASFGATGNLGAFPNGTSYLVLGLTNNPYTQITNFAPRFLEVYNNRLFLSGFSTTPSTVWFSETGEPEGYQADWNFQVRTNDGDRITAKKSYGGQMLIFKQKSFHSLIGDGPNNFFLKEVSDEYGCLSHRAVDIYNDTLVFLDRKGLMEFNGANIKCLSDKIQPVVDTINFAAALDKATVAHDKSRNQLLVGVPTNGATMNNTTLVYDYLVSAWTIYDGISPSVYSVMQSRLSNRTIFYGGYSGMFFDFGASYFGDNGVGFSCYLKSRFLNDMGNSVEKQFRRLYLDVSPIASITVGININFFSNYGTSIVLGSSMFFNPSQSRIDFGISAKSMAFEMSANSASTGLRLHGYTIEHRYQRST